jgi:hypothetical protein
MNDWDTLKNALQVKTEELKSQYIHPKSGGTKSKTAVMLATTFEMVLHLMKEIEDSHKENEI